ncbi:hypothetical protein JXJ21_03665 [candidate division KSB1 bacterium]|nr:hypothetical protein [candidate division KSB1 bacterium]
MCDQKIDMDTLLPDQVMFWTPGESDRVYDSSNLFDYIDGGAELYLSYGFQKMLNRTYSATGQPDIIVDIFEMGSAENAYGVFSHSREVEDTTFGQGSQYTAGLLLFWKDRFYVSILASPETDESKAAVFRLAQYIEQKIPANGALPALLQALPEETLVRESIRYFHHYIWLNSYYFVSNENILHINEQTDAVLAQYGAKPDRSILLVIQYPADDSARAAYQNFRQDYLSGQPDDPIVKVDEKNWIGGRCFQRYVILVFNSATKENTVSIIEKTVGKLNILCTGTN